MKIMKSIISDHNMVTDHWSVTTADSVGDKR